MSTTAVHRSAAEGYAALPADEKAKATKQVRAPIARTPALAGKNIVTLPYMTLAYSARTTG